MRLPEKRPDYLDDTHGGTWTTTILAGIVLPVLLGGYGIYCCIVQKAVLPSRYVRTELLGTNAVLAGCSMIFLAFFFHFRNCWAYSEKLYRSSELMQGIAIICAIIPLLTMIYRLFIS